jgi:hypothetical protein
MVQRNTTGFERMQEVQQPVTGQESHEPAKETLLFNLWTAIKTLCMYPGCNLWYRILGVNYFISIWCRALGQISLAIKMFCALSASYVAEYC